MSLDIRSEDFNKNIDMLERISDKYYELHKLEIEAKKKYEKEILIKNHKGCPPNIDPAIVASHLSSLDTKKLKADMTGRFYDASIMEAAACVATSTFFEDTSKVREYFGNDLKIIGDPSAYGIAMAGSLGQTANSIVLKAPMNSETPDELIHEACIAFYGTNKLRSLGIPNFAYVYGSFICTGPYTEGRDIISFCNKEAGGVSYAIYENINPSVSMQEYCRGCTPKDFLYNYIQLMLSLRMAKKECDFTHYDLHYNNVLMRKYPDGVYYVKFDDVWCLGNDVIPTIIDYGRCHILKNDVHIGYSIKLIPPYRDRSFIMGDAYRLLNGCLYEMMFNNPKCFDDLALLFNFFNKSIKSVEDVEIFLNNRAYNQLPYTQRTADLTDDEWQAYLKEYMLPEIPGDSKCDHIFEKWIDHCRGYCIVLGYEDPVTIKPQKNIMVLSEQLNIGIEKEMTDLIKKPEVDSFASFVSVEESLFNEITKQRKILESMESLQVLELRTRKDEVKKEYTLYIIKNGLNKNDKDLYDKYYQLTNEYNILAPKDRKYKDIQYKYEALDRQYMNMIEKFINNFLDILIEENIKYQKLLDNMEPFKIVDIQVDLMFYSDFLDEIKEFTTKSVKYFKVTDDIRKTIIDIDTIISKIGDLLPPRELTALEKLKYKLKDTINEIFTNRLIETFNRDIEIVKKSKNPETNYVDDAGWYFTTYVNIDSFFPK